MPSLHPTAIVDSGADLGEDVEVGPWCEIGAGARVGPGSVLRSRVKLGPNVSLGSNNRIETGTTFHEGTSVGDDNYFSEGSVVGGMPLTRDLSGPFGTLEIGSRNKIREFATIQTGSSPGQVTRIGDDNIFLSRVQVGHDCLLGNEIVATNNLVLSGHVVVEDCVVFGIGASVHQYCRIGAYSMVGATAYVSQHVPPYLLLDGRSGKVVGLNRVGLQRNGFSQEEMTSLKQAYRIIYRSGLNRAEILQRLERELPGERVDRLREFLARSDSRGIVGARKK